MQQLRKRTRPLSFGEIVVVAVDFVLCILSGAALWFLVTGGPSLRGKPFLWALLLGLALAMMGTLASAVCLLVRHAAARSFQSVGAVGGLFLILSLVLFLSLPVHAPVLFLCILYGVPAAVLIGLAVYVRSITRRDAI